MTANNQQTASDPMLDNLDLLADLMDNKFRIPFTRIRFGLDAILGLFPYAGDITGLVISLWIIGITIRKGAGPFLLLRMAGNAILDAIAGTIPFVGDIFDLGFKANRRNINLLKAYYSTGQKRPNALWSYGFFFLLLICILIGIIWLGFKAIAYFWGLIF